MAIPSESYFTLVGGLNAENSTIYTNNLIKIGDTVKISGTVSNNGTFTVADIVSTANSASGLGTTFTDSTCDTNSDTSVSHNANAQIIAGLSVSGTGIQSGTFISSITNSTSFVLSKPATATNNNVTLTFGDMDIYYVLKGGTLSNESSAGSTNPKIEVVRAPGDKLVALGDAEESNGIDVWSDNATTDYVGISPASANGWEENAITPTISGSASKFVFHFIDEGLRVCDSNDQNTSLIKFYGYIQRQQFNNEKGLIFAEWQEHPNNLASPKLGSGEFTYCYGHSTHTGNNNATSYYQNNRGVVVAKKDSDGELQLNGLHTRTATEFTFEKDDASANVLDQSTTGEVITIGTALGATPEEFLFCKKESGPQGGAIVYSRAYGGALAGTAPASYSDQDKPILERGLGFNIAVSDNTCGEGFWEKETYEFYQTFVYDNNQESIPVLMGDGESSIDKFTFTTAGLKSLRVSVFADLAYSARITGGRVYTRISETDDDLILIADIDIVKGVRTKMDGDHVPWTIDSDSTADGYYVLGDAGGNINSPGIDTYTTINGFAPDINFVALGGYGENYKASTIANRRTFIANVKIKGKGGELEKFGDRIMFSEINKFDTFLEHNFIDVSKGDFGEYTALESYADRLVAFKNNLVHIINVASPNISNWYLETTIKNFGVNFPFSVTRTDNGIAWVSDNGCYLYNGSSVQNLSDRRISMSNPSYSATDVNWQDWYRGSANLKDVMIGYDPISNSLIMFRSPDDNTTNSNTGWIYDFDTNGWIYHDSIFTDSATYTNFITDWNNNLTVGEFPDSATTVNFKKFLPVQKSVAGQEFVTKDIDFGQPGLVKKIYKVIITYKSDGAETTPFSYSVDGKQNFSGDGGGTFTGNFADTSGKWDVLTLTPSSFISCQSIQIRFDAPSAGKFEINDMTIQYRTIRSKEVA
tara:strand:+ start:21779 stop:24571 length:2793 start_codon:yes stop_codon:yes gene_type:complete